MMRTSLPVPALLGSLLLAPATLAQKGSPADQQQAAFLTGPTWNRFLAEAGGSWDVRWCAATGTPSAIYGSGIALADWRGNTIDEARRQALQLLQQQHALLGLGTSNQRAGLLGSGERSQHEHTEPTRQQDHGPGMIAAMAAAPRQRFVNTSSHGSAPMLHRTVSFAVSLALLLSGLAPAQDPTPYPTPRSKKGLQVQMVDDALALGTAQAAVNVDLGALADVDGGDDAVAFEHDGRTFWFRTAPLAALDAQVAPLARAGVLVSAILLAIQTHEPARDRLVVHGGCQAKAPNGITAFATDTADGRAWLTAVSAMLTARYSGDAPHGRIWNWIVGNEVNSHWWWYHLGRAELADVVAAYATAVRCVHRGVRSQSRHGRVFVSLEHHWNVRYAAGDERQATPGRVLLDAFAARVRQDGDFDWHVAFHPYPEDLFECRFWRDRSAPDRDDAARVTFRNLPVLMRHLARPELQWRGAPRRVILSEQGFHCADGEHGERDQAAAFALGWALVQREPGIDAFVLHRHVDHAHEGGLRLGLWTRQPDSVCTPRQRRRMAEVFAACDTAAWPACAAFALPVVGCDDLRSWRPIDAPAAAAPAAEPR